MAASADATPDRSSGQTAMSSADSGMLLLGLSAWVRRQSWLRALYRRFPQRLRDKVSFMLAARASRRARFAHTPAWSRALPEQAAIAAPAAVRDDTPGVNIFAYLRGQFGLAESARMYGRALIEAGYPVALHDIAIDLPHGLADRSLDAHIGEDATHAISIIFVNPDYLDEALRHIGEAKLKGRYLIACWFWELEEIPADWLPALDQVDEILVATEFVERAFRRVTAKPILRVPLPLCPVPDSGLTREDFGLAPDRFVFLVTFDFNSWIHRKNPFAVVEAFQRAFPPERDDVQLLLKSSNGYRHPDNFLSLLALGARDPRIVVRDEVIDRAHVHALQRCADAYVSLHRAEGFGLGLAESMALGKPVIGTGWSGNLEFMDENDSCLVGYSLVPVGEGEYPHPPGAMWAQADVEQAAAHMRRLADDRAFAAELGRRARESVRRTLAPQAAADAIAARLRDISATLARDAAPSRPAIEGSP
ncbi:glycosyl transferase, group 1 family protein [Lysobacter enzymogenes]|uniref:Glycosyl transferase, group 1 family protein n=2 Tax=Lysobacter enzymogenes TaxID=69 RepID=A0A0S2DM89_LYSEN|nr:glycosyl transferase, group 1 family protein [Lysobacter enzymogenes]